MVDLLAVARTLLQDVVACLQRSLQRRRSAGFAIWTVTWHKGYIILQRL